MLIQNNLNRNFKGLLSATNNRSFFSNMTALSAKIIAMKILGYNVIPAIFIIPAFNIIAIICAAAILKNIKTVHLNK